MKNFKIALLLALGLSLGACSNETESIQTEESIEETEPATASVVQEGEGVKQGNKGGNSTIEIDWSLKPEVSVSFDESYTLEEMLNLAVEDEYKAKNTYVAIVDTLGDVSPFSSIITSELSHIESLSTVFDAHGFVRPQDPNSTDAVLTDLVSALEAAVQAEVNNIAMYDHFLTLTDEEDVKEVFELLKTASESHLESFMMSLQRQGS